MSELTPERLREAADIIAELNTLQGFKADEYAMASPRYLRREADRMDIPAPRSVASLGPEHAGSRWVGREGYEWHTETHGGVTLWFYSGNGPTESGTPLEAFGPFVEAVPSPEEKS